MALALRPYMADHVTRMHKDVEVMTRQLELEKRRLQRLNKEVGAAKQTHETKMLQRLGKGSADAEDKRPASAASTAAQDGRRSSSGTNRLSRAATEDAMALSARQSTARRTALTEESLLPSSARGERRTAATGISAPLRALLNRLEVQQKKLDQNVHENRDLRESIDVVRREKTQLNQIFDRLKTDIRHRTGQLLDFVEETTASRAVHSDAQQRVSVMKRQRDSERAQFKLEVLKLREQLQVQDWEKKEVEVQLKRAEQGVQKKKELVVPEEESGFSENLMMRRILKNAFLNCTQRRKIKQHQKSIEVFEQAFSTIKQSTGIDQIEEIVQIFVALESRNYSLLTYINHMNREIEALEAQRRWRQTADVAKRDADEKCEDARTEALGDLQRYISTTQFSITACRAEYHQQRDCLAALRPLLRQIASRISEEVERLKAAGPYGAELVPPAPGELHEENIPEWLEWVEQALGRWRELLPPDPTDRSGEQPFPCTAATKVRALPPKSHRGGEKQTPLVKMQELPSALGAGNAEDLARRGGGGNATAAGLNTTGLSQAQKDHALDEESEEEDFGDRPLMIKDIRARAEQSAARRRGRKNQGRPRAQSNGGSHGVSPGATGRESVAIHSGASTSEPRGASRLGHNRESPLGSDQGGSPEAGLGHGGQDALAELPEGSSSKGDIMVPRALLKSGTMLPSETEVSEEEISDALLKRYKMSREELQLMADRLNIHIMNLCFLKQEFDLYDEDRSGYIDARELKGLLKKLGEDLNDDQLDQAFRDLDSDGSGEVEFFEFVEWFTSSN